MANTERELSQTKQLVQFYIKDLNDDKLVVKQIEKRYPSTFQLAIAKLAILSHSIQSANGTIKFRPHEARRANGQGPTHPSLPQP